MFVLPGCNSKLDPVVESTDVATPETNYVYIKYRDSSVDLAAENFEYLNTEGSSFIAGAWYDSSNKYMVIKLLETYYHYCDMPESVWRNFKRADSFGVFYNEHIKEKFDCRSGTVPAYE